MQRVVMRRLHSTAAGLFWTGRNRCANRRPLLGTTLLGHRSMLVARVITATGADLKFLVAARLDLYLHRAITADALRRAGLVLDRVLVADIVRDLRGDRLDLAQVPGKERDTAGVLRHCAKRSARPLGMLLAEQPDGVNRGTILLFKAAQSLLQRLAAGVVFAVGHHQEHLLFQRAAFFQVIA